MIKINRLSYQVKNRTIINDLNLVFSSGEFVCIVGANGAGKSTLLRLLAAELKPASGHIEIAEKDLNCYSLRELASFRAYLHQHNSMEMAFSVEEIIGMGRYFSSNSKTYEQKIIEEVLNLCSLIELRDRSIKELSGGEQQRVHLARVLAQLWDVDNGILMLDEPISNMDVQYQQQTLAIAKALTKVGFLVIAVLHDLNLVAQYADAVLMMKQGRAWWFGTPNEVFKQQNIYSIFGVDSEITINPNTLETQIFPQAIRINLAEYNSRYQKNMENIKEEDSIYLR